MFKLKLACIAALFMGPFLLINNFNETREKEKIDREGIAAPAMATSKVEEKRRKGGKKYKLDIEYPVESGKTTTARIEVSKTIYDHIETQPILKIKYLKDQPEKLIVVGEPLSDPGLNYFGGGLFLFGAFGTWWQFIRKTPAGV